MSYSSENTKGIWALGIVLVLLTLGGLFAYFDKTPTPKNGNSITPTPFPSEVAGTENWRTLKTDALSLKYPSDFTVQKSTSTVALLVPVKAYFHTILANEAYVTVYPPSVDCPPSKGETFEATTTLSSIDRTVFFRVGWSGVGAGQFYKGADYTTIHDGKCWQISLYTHSADGAAFYFNTHEQIEFTDKQHAEDLKVFLDVIDKTVSTFQFTPR